MTAFTITELKTILDQASGADEELTLDESVLDESLRDLGYDSLAVLEVATWIQRELGVQVGDDDIDDWQTARKILDSVNDKLAAVA